MVKKIELLSPEQEALLPVYRDKWIAIGLATGPTDYAATEQAISELYHTIGLESPRYLHSPSPFHGALEAQTEAGQQIEWQVWQQINRQVWRQIEKYIGQRVWQQTWWQIGQQVEQQVQWQFRQQVWSTGYDPLDIGWLGCYDYLLEVCHIKKCKKMESLICVAKMTGWWWPSKDFCIITPHPSVLCRDERGNLHCEDGPALDYDGTWGVYSWHGISVPRNIIEHPESITTSDISGEQNAEVRRVMIARYGYERYCKDTDAKMLHRDDWGTLWQIENMRIVEVVNSTPEPDGTWKHYWLRVPPTMETAHAAVAWTNYETEETYDPAVQT